MDENRNKRRPVSLAKKLTYAGLTAAATVTLIGQISTDQVRLPAVKSPTTLSVLVFESGKVMPTLVALPTGVTLTNGILTLPATPAPAIGSSWDIGLTPVVGTSATGATTLTVPMFNPGSIKGIQVVRNGLILRPADYTFDPGSLTVTLNTATNADDWFNLNILHP